MQTSKWGPSAWDFLHTITFNYPENPSDDLKKNYFELFNNLRFTLPCKYCRDSYKIFFRYIDINKYLNDRMGISYWLYIIHNLVNSKLNKKPIDFIDVVNHYEKRRSGQINENCKIKFCKCTSIICCCKESCHCNQCKKNFDFVNKTKLKYDEITKNFTKKLIFCDELKI
jgi:hypothetical protein